MICCQCPRARHPQRSNVHNSMDWSFPRGIRDSCTLLLIKIHIKTTKKTKRKWGFSTVCIDFILHTTTCFRCGVFDWVKTLRVPLFQPGNKVYMLRYTGSVIVHTFTLLYCHKKKCSKMCFLSIVRVLPVVSIMSGKYVEHYQNCMK